MGMRSLPISKKQPKSIVLQTFKVGMFVFLRRTVPRHGSTRRKTVWGHWFERQQRNATEYQNVSKSLAGCWKVYSPATCQRAVWHLATLKTKLPESLKLVCLF